MSAGKYRLHRALRVMVTLRST